MGIPKDSVLEYELALKSDNFLVLAHGTADEVAKAKDIMQSTRPVGVELYAAESAERAGVSAR